MRKIDYNHQTVKRQVAVPTIHPDQIKKNLGVTLTKNQKEFFSLIVMGCIHSKGHPSTIRGLIAKNLIRVDGDTHILTEKGKAYAKLKSTQV